MKQGRHWLQNWNQRTISVVARIGSDPSDEDEIRLQKSLLVICALLFMVAGWAWGLMYFFFREPLAGSIPFPMGSFPYSAFSTLHEHTSMPSSVLASSC